MTDNSASKLLSGFVSAADLDGSYVGYRTDVNLGNSAESLQTLTIASVEPLDHYGRPGVRLTFVEYPGHHFDTFGNISITAPSVERQPFVPAKHYAPGGAALADAIERLEFELNEIKLTIDAHRAALVAAGLLDVNGEPRRPADWR